MKKRKMVRNALIIVSLAIIALLMSCRGTPVDATITVATLEGE